MAKKAVEKVDQGSENTESSSEFEDVFDVDYSAPFASIGDNCCTNINIETD